MAIRLLGTEKVLSNMNKAIAKVKNGSMKGLIESAIIIRRSMDKESPKIPVDTSNLRASWFTTPLPTASAVRLGFTANYATFVHENMEANYKREGAGSKFLEAALIRNKLKIIQTIKSNVNL